MDNVKLDEKYLCTAKSSKNEILNVINSFINQNPSFCPKARHRLCGNDFKKYCDDNGYIILDEYFLASKMPKNLRSNSYTYGNNYGYTNDIAIVSDSEKNKKILVKRSSGKIKEISNLLSIETLYSIWDTFVNKVVSYQYALRKLKELKNSIEVFNENSDILYCSDKDIQNTNKILSFVSIGDVNMNLYDRTVTFKRTIYKYNQKDSLFYRESSNEGMNLSIPSFNEMVLAYKKMLPVKLPNLKELIKAKHYSIAKSYEDNFNESMTFIETLMNN